MTHGPRNWRTSRACVIIRSGDIVGRFPSRALRLVLEWRELHEAELIENWNRLQGGLQPEPIQPLD